MIISFKDKVIEDIFNGKFLKIARKSLPNKLCKVASRKLDQLDSVMSQYVISANGRNLYILLKTGSLLSVEKTVDA